MKTSVAQAFLGVSVFSLAATAAYAADAVSGRVMAGGSPAANVRVTHIRTGIADTTSADGLFELKMPKSSLADGREVRAPGFALRGSRLELENPERGAVIAALFGLDGREEAVLFRGELPAGSQSLPLALGTAAPGLHVLSVSAGGSVAAVKLLLSARGLEAREGFQSLSAPALRKAAADNDTVVFAGKQLFTLKKGLASFAPQEMGDVTMEKNPIGTSNIVQDKFDQFIMDGVKNRGLDQSLAMVLKAMIVIESSFKVDAISMWDTQLPCGTHSYGLIQVTPGCERGYATLNGGVAATASISGGLNGNAAVLSWFNAADKTSGNTIVQEAGITIDLVTNPASQYWATSAFNPAYSIDHGAKAVSDVMGTMKRSFGGCTAANYVAMTLAGYNQGESTVPGCTAYSANGQKYQENVLKQYRLFCTSAGVTPVY